MWNSRNAFYFILFHYENKRLHLRNPLHVSSFVSILCLMRAFSPQVFNSKFSRNIDQKPSCQKLIVNVILWISSFYVTAIWWHSRQIIQISTAFGKTKKYNCLGHWLVLNTTCITCPQMVTFSTSCCWLKKFPNKVNQILKTIGYFRIT